MSSPAVGPALPAEPTAGRAAALAWRAHPAGLLLAAAAAYRHALLMTSAPNDTFVHLTFAQQWLAGDWPVRDFFGNGWVLQFALSALGLALGGDRLLPETAIVSAAWAISTYLVFHLVRRMTGSTAAAALAALLPIVAGARVYSYPKGIVYAVAAALWWSYTGRPVLVRAAALGAWAAVAFYWRPDHGVFAAIGAALAAVAAHGIGRRSLIHVSAAAAAMAALVLPFLLYVQATVGIPPYFRAGVSAAIVEHTTQGPHQWPLLRFGRDLITVAPAAEYAPTAAIRWTAGSPDPSRSDLLARYGLTLLSRDGDTDRVRLSARTMPMIRALINEPLVEDTAGIDRSTGTLPPSSWPTWRRLAFRHAWLRVRVLPDLEGQALGAELAVALFYLLPIAVAVAAPWMRRRLTAVVTTGRLVAFAAFAFLVDLAMLRVPFEARAADGVVLSAILFGCCAAWLWRVAAGRAQPSRGALQAGTIALVLASATAVAAAGRFGEVMEGLAHQAASPPAARDEWRRLASELVSSPPLRHYVDSNARFSLRLAAYVRECLRPSDRLLVLWFEPEVYFFSGRLMAQRHLVFAPAWAALEDEQRMTLEKIQRYDPPLVLARRSALDTYARATFPGVVEYVERAYDVAATLEDDGEEYLILARRGRPALRRFGPQQWPCFTAERSLWSRVGRPPS